MLKNMRSFLYIICMLPGIVFSQAAIIRQGLSLTAKRWNNIEIQDDSGLTMLTLKGFNLKWTPNVKTIDGEVIHIADNNKQEHIKVIYKTDNPGICITGCFTPYAGRVDISYEITGIPTNANVGGSMFLRQMHKEAEALPEKKLGLWKRHEYGGQPVEIPDGKLVPYRLNRKLICLAFDTENKANPSWQDGYSQHTGLTKVKDQEGAYTSNFSVLLCPDNWPDNALAALWHGRPLGISLSTDQIYNWWTSGKQDQMPVTLNVDITNASETDREVTVKHWIRDFAGHIISKNTRDVTLPALYTVKESIPVKPSPESFDPTRDIFFAEVSVTDKKTGTEFFSRTNLALLPPYNFDPPDKNSIFGLAAYWPIPDEASVQRLMKRMGVRWLRNGDSRNYENITPILHNQIKWKLTEQSEREEWIRSELKACVDKGNPCWEYGNEINYGLGGIGLGDVFKKEQRAKRIAEYVDWLKTIDKVQKEMGPPASDVKILSVGLAGMDVRFVEDLYEAGAWGLIDGLAIHPGRGNFTADYPITEPWIGQSSEQWSEQSERTPNGNYWNYYGAVRSARRLINKYGGDKELWLTEVYTPGFPNSFWEDSLRNATENLLLSFALAKAENVKAVLWYQLFDGVWFNRLGVNPEEREYFFGLIQRDLSFKPALMAYCATAEELSDATFVRWLKFPQHKNTRGMLFKTPRGPLSILWDRTDGYILTEKRPFFASPEPWADNWKSKVSIDLPTTGGKVTRINSIGQRQSISTTAENISIVLTGAPVMIYGLDPDRLK